MPLSLWNNVAEVLAHPQLLARDMIQEIDFAGRPVPFSRHRCASATARNDSIPYQQLGEDTESVLRDLGYTDAEIAAFRPRWRDLNLHLPQRGEVEAPKALRVGG